MYYYVPLPQFLRCVLVGPCKTDFQSSVLFGPTKIHCLYVSGTCYGFFCLLPRSCTGVAVFYVRSQCCCSVRHYFWMPCFARASQNILVFLSISVCYLRFTSVLVRDVIKDEIGGKLPSGRPFRPDVRVYPADAVLPADGFLPSADAVKTASARTLVCVRADAKKINK
jgi:hypothetical protein